MTENKRSLEYILRLLIKITLVGEIIIYLMMLTRINEELPANFVMELRRSRGIWIDLNVFLISLLGPSYYKMLIYGFPVLIMGIQVYIYKIIGSYWRNMRLTKKAIIFLVVVIPGAYFGSIAIAFIVSFVIAILIIIILLWTLSLSKPSTEDQLNSIKRKLDEINRK